MEIIDGMDFLSREVLYGESQEVWLKLNIVRGYPEAFGGLMKCF